jgi:hypothetical protein
MSTDLPFDPLNLPASDLGEDEPAPGIDTRQTPRFRWPFVFGASTHGAIYDISTGGVCLAAATPLSKGSAYTLVLTNGWRRDSQTLQARVLWWRKGRAGLEWVDLLPDQRRWLEECCRDCALEQAPICVEAAPLAP